MKKEKEPLLVPFDDKGNMLFYYGGYKQNVTQREFPPTALTLRVFDIRATRAAATTFLKDGDHHQYPMFLTDLVECLRVKSIDRGTISGIWSVAKRGANYGIHLDETDPDRVWSLSVGTCVPITSSCWVYANTGNYYTISSNDVPVLDRFGQLIPERLIPNELRDLHHYAHPHQDHRNYTKLDVMCFINTAATRINQLQFKGPFTLIRDHFQP